MDCNNCNSKIISEKMFCSNCGTKESTVERITILITYQQISKTGGRDNNEDSAISVEANHNYCFVVADGLGGHGKGEVASQLVVEVFEREFTENFAIDEGFLASTFQKAQNEVVELQQLQKETGGMKTTAVVLTIARGECSWGHIGDSRLYIFDKNRVKLRTLDHSVPQMLVAAGAIKEKHISTHPDRNRILRAIGGEGDSPKYELAQYNLSLEECQAFLLCTDGFWEHITEKKMCKLLKRSKTVKEWLDAMVEEVEKNGTGRNMDNYTAIAIKTQQV